MHDGGFLVPIVFFGFLAAIIIVPQVLKSRDRQQMYETMRAAYEKGQPVPPDFMEAMARRSTPREFEAVDAYARPPSERDLRRGVVWTAIGTGLFLIGAVGWSAHYGVGWDDGGRDWFSTFAFLGAIPMCVGVAFLVLWGVHAPQARSLTSAPTT